MADLKISQLTGATTPLAGTEVLPIVQSSSTKKVAVSDLTAGRQVAFASAVAGSVTPLPFSTNANSSFYQVGSVSFVVGAAGLGGPGTEFVRNAYFDGAWKYASTSSAMRYSQAGGQHIFYRAVSGTAGTGVTWIQNFTISAADDVTFNAGNLIQGTAGKGINFTANTPAAGMTSELLNWYEEGTFTPTLTTDGTDFTSVSYTDQVGTYTRIGRSVSFSLVVYTSAVTKGSASGNVQIDGLPFVQSSSASRCSPSIGTVLLWAGDYPSAGEIQASSSKISLLKRAAANGTTSNSVVADVATSAGNFIRISGTYFV